MVTTNKQDIPHNVECTYQIKVDVYGHVWKCITEQEYQVMVRQQEADYQKTKDYILYHGDWIYIPAIICAFILFAFVVAAIVNKVTN